MFGGSDDDAFLEPEKAIEFVVNNNLDDYSLPINSWQVGTGEPQPQTDRQVVFDPAYPYIYMPEPEFLNFATYMTKVFKTPWLTENVCETKKGTCIIPTNCTGARKKFEDEDKDFTLTLNIEGTNNATMAVTLPWADMLMEPRESEMTDEEKEKGKQLCYLPIYGLRNEVSTKWIIGKVLMEKFYTVFDLTQKEEGDSITIKMGEKNPKYKKNPDVPGGGGDDDKPINQHKSKVTIVILAIVIVIATLGLLYTCIKKKQRNDSTF